jgi:hypothetical protein
MRWTDVAAIVGPFGRLYPMQHQHTRPPTVADQPSFPQKLPSILAEALVVWSGV